MLVEATLQALGPQLRKLTLVEATLQTLGPQLSKLMLVEAALQALGPQLRNRRPSCFRHGVGSSLGPAVLPP